MKLKQIQHFKLSIAPSFNYSKSRTLYSSSDETLDQDKVLTNESAVNSNVENLGKEFSNELSVTKNFGSNGAFLRFKLENSISVGESDDFLNSNTEIFGSNPETINRNQFTDGEKNSNGLSTELAYRLPIIAKKLFLNFEYEYARDKDENRESTFDFNEASEVFTDFNTDLSTDFEYTDSRSIPGVSFKL